jgi:hypothetical protein
MHPNLPHEESDSFPGELLQTITLAALETHYRGQLGDAYLGFPSLLCDLERLALMMPVTDLISVIAPEVYAMIWLMRVDECGRRRENRIDWPV